jgi:hypothetical protein
MATVHAAQTDIIQEICFALPVGYCVVRDVSGFAVTGVINVSFIEKDI